MEISWTSCLIATIVTIVSFIVYRRKTYWKRRGVPACGNLLTGCFIETFRGKENLAVGLERMYIKNKNEKYVGTFVLGQPLLVLNDPKIIKQVFLTEYPAFSSHGFFYDTKSEDLSAHVFSLSGQDWKGVRSKLTPLFSSGKIKAMFDIVLNKVEYLEKKIDKNDSDIIPFNVYMRKLSIDVICSCFFGIESNCLDDEESVFTHVSVILNESSFGQLFNFLLFTNFHKVFSFLTSSGFTRLFPQAVNKFMIDLLKDVLKHRSKSGEKRNDFIDMLIRLQHSANDGTSDEARDLLLNTDAAQFFILFGAGFDTTSQANAIAVFEMAKQPEIQRKVQEECDRLLKEAGGKITYEALSKMEYTEKVIKETLRLHPALPILIRSTVKSCKLPTTDVQLEKDTNVWVSLQGLHRDPQYFPDPLKFNPERFSPENEASIPPFVYMPFGEGPRTCIGMRFAFIAMKITILRIMSRYNVTLTKDTPENVEYEPLVYFPVLSKDIPLRLTPRANNQ